MIQWKMPWVVAALLLAAGCSNGHDTLSSEVQSVGFEDSFEFLVERRIGPEQCFMADCPAIDRYYLTDQDPESSCVVIGELLAGTEVSPDLILGEESCRYLGSIGSVRLDVRATDPITEIPPDDQTLYPFPVTDPHGAVVVVSASRDE